MRNGQRFYEQDIIYDRERSRGREPEPEPEPEEPSTRELDLQISRRRSVSARPSRADSRRSSGRKVTKDMWTEVTKDLVTKEAIDEMGYEYEDNEHFFYVMEYLKYVSRHHLAKLPAGGIG